MVRDSARLQLSVLARLLIAVSLYSLHGASVLGDEQEPRLVRVAFVHHALDMGGVERQIQATWGAVDKKHLEAEVILLQDRGEWAENVESLGMPVQLFKVFDRDRMFAPDWKSEFEKMTDYLKERFDVIHTWYGGGQLGSFSTFGTEIGKHAGLPVIQNMAWNVVSVDLDVAVVVVECDETENLHGGELAEHFGIDASHLRQLGVPDANHDAILLHGFPFPSPMQGGEAFWAGEVEHMLQARQQGRMKSAREGGMPVVVRINPGVDTAKFDPGLPRLRAIRQQAEAQGRQVVGRISRLVPEKDPEAFVRAAAAFVGRRDVVFRLWGDGPERPRLERLSAELGLGGVLEFRGATDDPPAALAEMSVFAYPTTGESVGWVVLEAMAMGLPVISSHVGAVPTFVRDGETGFVIAAGEDPEVLGGMVESLLESRELQREIGGAARDKMVHECELARFGREYTALYHSVAAAYAAGDFD